MRKLLIMLAATLLSVPAVGFAQAPSFGLKGGLNMANYGGRRIVTSDYRAGLNLGAFVSIPVTATLAIQPEVFFSRKGGKNTGYDYDDMPQDGFAAPPIGVYIHEKSSNDYVEIPLLFKLDASLPGESIRPILFAGPAAGIMLSGKGSFYMDDQYKEQFNTVDFSLIIGGGVEFGKLSLDARYNLGLSSIAKDYDSSIGVIKGDIKSRAFTVMAGVRLF